ncbi:hypothetical protein MT391_16775 [Vibrio sp. 1-Bac 57]
MEFSKTVVEQAYLYLKSYAYHENLNLFLKQRVAEFECDRYEAAIQAITDVLNDEDPSENVTFKGWLSAIDYHLMPKEVVRPEDKLQKKHNKRNGLFISNVTVSEKYQVSKVNYFINAPIELHIIDVLWSLKAGSLLDNNLTKDCYGNRMRKSKLDPENNKASVCSHEIFKRYIEQYNQWRDQAINIATELSNEQDDVAILSLDLKSYYYQVDYDFSKFNQVYDAHISDSEERSKVEKLTILLEDIFDDFNHKTALLAKQTHPDCKEKYWLPIGFSSSSIIANWYLSEFDSSISDVVRPAYYGRYVDDILLVFKRPKFDEDKPIESFIERYLNGLLQQDSKTNNYYITVDNNKLPLQRDKLIFQYFEKNHSKAGLEVFKQELDERSSAFKFLPSEHIDKELGKFAYDVLYDGSANKLRSIVGLSKNETELAKYLSSHITAHRLCKLDNNNSVLPELKLFFKGSSALQFSRLWEKVYQYALVTKRYDYIRSFLQYLNSEILKIEGINPDSKKVRKQLTNELKRDLSHYNNLSLSLTVALLDLKKPSTFQFGPVNKVFHSSSRDILSAIVIEQNLYLYAWRFRQSNLLRHHLVSWPLANYSSLENDLTDEQSFIGVTAQGLCDDKLKLSPRYIHLDEWQLFHLPNSLTSPEESLNQWQTDTLHSYKVRSSSTNLPVSFIADDKYDERTKKSTLTVGDKVKTNSLRVALANIVVKASDIDSAIRNDKLPNVSFSRQKTLYEVLNSAIKEKADLLLMPEVSIPVSWLPFMVAHARRHQIGIIFGLEHWVSGDYAYNLLIEVLPFKVSGKYKSCTLNARLKNHYAPAELELIDSLRLKPANSVQKPYDYYHNVRWKGINFATYNCFELSDIQHRTLFKSEVDLLFACVWNRDTNYYQHILESAVRDLHCYVVQSNTSQYGGSCVLRPTKTESKTMLYVKGGNNASVLTVDIDIAGLRYFQFKSKPGDRETFKHLPPGFDHEKLTNR